MMKRSRKREGERERGREVYDHDGVHWRVCGRWAMWTSNTNMKESNKAAAAAITKVERQVTPRRMQIVVGRSIRNVAIVCCSLIEMLWSDEIFVESKTDGKTQQWRCVVVAFIILWIEVFSAGAIVVVEHILTQNLITGAFFRITASIIFSHAFLSFSRRHCQS